jgi:hypothetical protein
MPRLAATLALALPLLVACGGRGSPARSALPGVTTTTVAGQASTTTATAATTTTATKAPAQTPGGGSAWCDLDRALQNSTNFQNVKDGRAWASAVNAMIPKLQAAAPAAIRADLQTLVAGLRTFLKVLAQANYNFNTLTPGSMAPLADPKLQAASNRIVAYNKQICGTKS